MSLARYRTKRNFDVTPEPPPLSRKSGKALGFFIQRHHARALHYDFRLELGGVLKSWAVPKGPSLDPHDKRLAVRVEDHPYDYGSFEGTIPAHQYGAGEVVLWDRGEWLPRGDAAAGIKKGRLEFELRGAKLNGRWILVRMGKADPDKENWLLIKETDSEARQGKDARITELRPESVKDAIPSSKAKTAKTHVDVESDAINKPSAKQSARPRQARKNIDAMPDMVDAQLATLAEQAPDGDDWLSEMKFDGYRALCRIEGGKARIFTREHLDWSKRWPQLVKALAALDAETAWIDGEVVAVLDDGGISFEALQDQSDYKDVQLVLYAFDLLYLNGQDLRDRPLLDRKQLLQELLSRTRGSADAIRFSEHVVGSAAEVYQHACMHGVEGTVVKRADAIYSGRRDRNWLKLKCTQRQEFVIAGYTDPAGTRTGFGALLMGVYDRKDGELHYSGRVGTGFNDHQLSTLLKKFKPLLRDDPAFIDPPRGSLARGVHWLEPTLVAEVKFAQWTKSGILRHGAFVALREDKPATGIVREKPGQADAEVKTKDKAAATSKSPATSSAGSTASRRPTKVNTTGEKADSIAGVHLTHPDKILFTDPDLSKRDLAQYYATVADWILPHLQQRPLTMVRCPDGRAGKCFFQRHLGQGVPATIEKIVVPEGEGKADYMMINDVSALVSTVQMGVLELHTWGASKGKLAKPDRVIFDLDPAPDVAWKEVVDGATLLHGLLQELGLTCFLKTSGGKGLHVVIPIVPEHDWDTVKQWSKEVAEHMAQVLPDHFTAKMSKAARTGKIYIDYLRNAAGATAVAAYSPRARPHAPVSAPLTWDELSPRIQSDSFTVDNIGARLAELKRDPWHDYEAVGKRQRLNKKQLKRFSSSATRSATKKEST